MHLELIEILQITIRLKDYPMWFEFLGNIVSAILGGIVAYLIVIKQIKHSSQQQLHIDKQNQFENEIRLLWDIYFDIKKDLELTDIFGAYKELLNKREEVQGRPLDEYLRKTIPYIMEEISDLIQILHEKEIEMKNNNLKEIELLWERTSQMLLQFSDISSDYFAFVKRTDEKTMEFQRRAIKHIKMHLTKIKQ